MTYPRNDDHFLIFSGSPGDLWQFVQKSTHKAAVVVGRPRGPLFTAARHCGTAHNYFPPPVSPKKKERRKNYTTKNNNTIKNSQRSAAAAAQERQKIRNKSIICVRYYYAWKWGRLLLLSGWQKNNWQPQRNAHTHTHTRWKMEFSGCFIFMSNTGGANITKVSVQSGFFLFFHFVKILVCAFLLSLFTFFSFFFFRNLVSCFPGWVYYILYYTHWAFMSSSSLDR